MKKLFLVTLAMFLGTQFIAAQTDRSVSVGDFTTIKAFDRLNIELIKSSKSKVEISGNKSEDVNVVQKNGELKIRMSTLKLLAGDDVVIKVYYKELSTIQASEGALVTSKDKIKTDNLRLNAKEGAKIDIKIDTDRVISKVNTGGQITLAGKTENQEISITSGGQYYGQSLSSEDATASVSAGGTVEIKASKYVSAKVNAGGRIEIYGKPTDVDQKTFAGGKVIIH